MELANLSQLSQAAIDEFKKAVQTGQGKDANALAKAAGVTNALGILNYDLQRPAKNLIPVLTPIRNRLPRVPANGGPATNWIQVTAINTKRLRSPVPEGTRNGVLTTDASPKAANYVTMGFEDFVTWQADWGAEQFEDIRATTAMRDLWAVMIDEEMQLIHANFSVALGTPTAPTLTVGASGGHVADGTAGYDVIVVALTGLGLDASSVSAAGVPGAVSVTPADGSSPFTYGAGSSIQSAATATGAVSHSNVATISGYTPAVTGAVGYAWYIGITGSGNIYLQQITKINSFLQTAALVTNTQKASALSGDNSKNLYGMDGYLSTAFAAGSNAYVKSMATGTNGTGTGLSAADADGIIPEIDAANRYHWDNYALGVDTWYVNSQEARNISKKVLAANPMKINYVGGQADVDGGVQVQRMLNPYTSTYQQIITHRYVPAGTILGVTHNLPYPMSNVPNVAEMKLRRDYFQADWPARTSKYEMGVYFDGVLAHYFPPSIAVINNIGNA